MKNTPLARTRNGRMVHRRDCPQIIRYNMFQSHATPWLWADDKTENEIAWWITHLSYKTCMHCRPINWHEVLWSNLGGGRPYSEFRVEL